MGKYIFGARNKIHIINLEYSLPVFNDALSFIGRLAEGKNKVMFVGTSVPLARSSVKKRVVVACLTLITAG